MCDMPFRRYSKSKKRWVRKVTTESTFPEKGIFIKDAGTIARHMASKKVSPKGVGSGIRMIQYFINRAGKGLPASRPRIGESKKDIAGRAKKRMAYSRTLPQKD
jgi:tRNA(adenine34) deaminase